MLFYVAIWVLKPTSVESLMPDSYNVSLKNSSHYKIEETINDEDYEMISKGDLVSFDGKHQENKFHELNKFAKRLYAERTKTNGAFSIAFKNLLRVDYDNAYLIKLSSPQASHSPHKRDVSNIETDYDYGQLLNEYYMETLHDATSNSTYHIKQKAPRTGFLYAVQKILDINSKCDEHDISVQAIKCIINDNRSHKLPLKTLLWRCWRILRIWLLVYLTIAVPLWCTRGLCCCCLFCEFFNPHRTIDSAKKYFVTNPPGLMKTLNGHEILYEPTKSERDSYEEFEHLIRTI